MRHALLFSVLLLFSACSSSRIAQGLQEGESGPEAFDIRLAFDARAGYLVVASSIQGQATKALLDTGSPSMLSRELADKLGLKIQAKGKYTDRYGQTHKLGFVQIDSIRLDSVVFRNTWAFVADFSDNPTLACERVDAVLGANLMRLAHWQIDFRNASLRLRHASRSLEMGRQTIELNFETNAAGTPIIPLETSTGVVKDLRLDTGFEGGLLLAGKGKRPANVITARGLPRKGLYQPMPDTLTLALLSGHRIAGQPMPTQIVCYESKGSSLAGNLWLSRYRIQLDWEAGKLYLNPYNNMQGDVLQSFGFGIGLIDGQLRIHQLFEQGPARRAGLRLGDRILFMNGLDCLNITSLSFCQMLERGYPDYWDTLEIMVEQGGATKKYTLAKEVLLAAPSGE
jgi:hypothetical protein